jgi:hypothetical protein
MGFLKKIKKYVVKPIEHDIKLIKKGHIMVSVGTQGTSVRPTN